MGKLIGAIIGFIFLGPLGAVIGALAGHFFIDGPRGSRGHRSQNGQGPNNEDEHEEARGGFFGRRFGGGFGRSFGGGFGGFGGFAGNFFGFGQSMHDQVQELYFQLMFSMMGKMAKADGEITKAEGDFLLDIISRMSLDPGTKSRAITYFNEAKNSSVPLTDMAQQFAQLCGRQPQLLRQMLYQLVGIAAAQGGVNTEEERIIRQVAGIFGLSEAELAGVFTAAGDGAINVEAAYAVLGVSTDADTDTVRAAYRKLLKECHPDVLRSKGLPKEMMDNAEKRFLQIQRAWESIKKERGVAK